MWCAQTTEHQSHYGMLDLVEKVFFKKKEVGHPRPLFLYFRLFDTQFDSKQIFNINKILPMTGFESWTALL